MPRSFGTAGIRRRHGAPICLIAGKTLRQLNDEDFAEFARALADAPNAGHHSWVHNSARAFSLHQACYELRICQDSPQMARRGPRARGGDLHPAGWLGRDQPFRWPGCRARDQPAAPPPPRVRLVGDT